MGFKEEIEIRRRRTSSTRTTMSIGELLCMFQERELDICQAFHQVISWDIGQKSRFVESVLLAIPLPTVYVCPGPRGNWEVLVGMQRIAAAFEFMGELTERTGPDATEITLKPPLKLVGTKNLPSLKDVTYADLGSALRIEFMRTRFDVKVIISTPGLPVERFELLERMSFYSEPLTPEERRACMLASLSAHRFKWIKALTATPSFRANLLLTDTQVAQQLDIDLALRFLLLRHVDPLSLGDFHDALRDELKRMALDATYDEEAGAQHFRAVFNLIDDKLNGDAFRQWDDQTHSFRGGFSMAAFEGLSFAVAEYWSDLERHVADLDLLAVVKAIWSAKAFRSGFVGLSDKERMAKARPPATAAIRQELKRVQAANKSTPSPAVKRSSKRIARQ